MNDTQVVARLRDFVKQEGSQERLAVKIGCSRSLIRDTLNGGRRPGPTILKFLGMQRTEVITRKCP